jgi:rhodanese-related sulfurtransferase
MKEEEKESCNIPRWQLLKNQLNNLSPTECQTMLDNNLNTQIIDVRTQKEFEISHLANALNINYLDDDFWTQIEQLDRTKPCLIYCRTGRRSVRTCTLMRNGGFENARIFNLDGGLAAWEEVYK